jgi:uncharacterized membrane protein
MEPQMERVKRNAVIAVGLSSLAVLILAATTPVFGWVFPHAVLGMACHQEPARCLSVAGLPMALCARCTAIFAGLFICSALTFVSAPTRRLALRLLLFAGCLTALDVLAEWMGLYANAVMVRLVTGWLLGSAVALMIGSREGPIAKLSVFPTATPCRHE